MADRRVLAVASLLAVLLGSVTSCVHRQPTIVAVPDDTIWIDAHSQQRICVWRGWDSHAMKDPRLNYACVTVAELGALLRGTGRAD